MHLRQNRRHSSLSLPAVVPAAVVLVPAQAGTVLPAAAVLVPAGAVLPAAAVPAQAGAVVVLLARRVLAAQRAAVAVPVEVQPLLAAVVQRLHPMHRSLLVIHMFMVDPV